MSSQAERKALVFIGAVACLALGARFGAREPGPRLVGGNAALARQLQAVDSARASVPAKGGKGAKGGRRRGAGRDTTAAVAASTDGAGERLVVPAPPPAPPPRPVTSLTGDALGMVAAGSVGRAGAGGERVAPIDVDVASAAEIEALPGIGPALARRIVADRESRGPFGGWEALRSVRGIGPRTAAALRGGVTFSGPPRPMGAATTEAPERSGTRRRGRARDRP